MATPRPRGKPSLLTRELEATLLAALRATPVKKYAAEHAGISEATWHLWERQGLEALDTHAQALGIEAEAVTLDSIIFEEGPHLHFLLSVRKARSDYLLGRLARIQQAGEGVEATVTKTTVKANGDVETTTTVKTERAWQAEAWLVERQYPEFRTQRLEVSGPDGKPVEISQESAAERLDRMLDEMASREAARPEILAGLDPEDGDKPVESVE